MPAPRGKHTYYGTASRPWNEEKAVQPIFPYETDRQRAEREACLNCTIPGRCVPQSRKCGLRGIGKKYPRKTPPKRPSDFEELAKTMNGVELRRHYGVTKYVVSLWRKECGT